MAEDSKPRVDEVAVRRRAGASVTRGGDPRCCWADRRSCGFHQPVSVRIHQI